MVKISLPDGSIKEVEKGTLAIAVAKELAPSLAKKSIVCKMNGVLKDLKEEINEDISLEFITADNKEESFEVINHSAAHLLAQAMQRLYKGTLCGVGPAIEEGFYYDFLVPQPVTNDDLAKIEAEMKKIVKENLPINHYQLSKDEAKKLFSYDKYKIELIDAVKGSDTVGIYEQGEYKDVCRGPHVISTGALKNFKLLSVAGAYWRGDSKNDVLTRIYGTCWNTAEELEAYLQLLEERKARDHRKLGKQLGIFMFDDLVGRGLPMWLPNGFIVRRLLADYIMDKEYDQGYQHVMTPSLGNVELYKTSGHWAHYKDDMFPKMDVDEESYVLRPMNCPHHMVMYRSTLHSYRDLPVKIAEIANDFRFEASGALTGIERTRAFSQNDAHIFCREDQIGEIFKEVSQLILDVYNDFGFKNYKFRLSLRDPNDTEKYFGNDALWEKSEKELREVLNQLGVDYYEAIGEAAFYGPKLDVQVRSAIGHDVTLSTIQLDYQLPERFELTYINENGEKVRPVVIHRAILGSMDRFVAFLIEETKGVFPVWLAPTQVKLIPVNLEYHKEFTDKLYKKLKQARIRVKVDYREEKLGYKIREAQMEKVPYQLVIGDNEVKNGTVTYRQYGKQEQTTVSIDEFINMIIKHNNELN
ncbi:MAG: threonine--tRNA ligase [Acholeplasmatales bacterium]|nr:threonine--tRNA ligase [Acholeplasmatales bacterium]